MKEVNTCNRLVVFAGPNGSGKSTITEKINKHHILPELYLNPDDIAKEINPCNAWYARIAAARKVLEERELYLSSNKSFSMETTLSGVSVISFVKKAIEKGYKTTVFFVAVEDAFENIGRVKNRVIKGGHDVPVKDVLRRRDRSLKNLPTIIDLVPRILVIDNSYGHRVILKKNNNKITFISEKLPKWFTSNISKEKLDNYRMESKEKMNPEVNLSKTYFYVPENDHKLVKSLGAKWDRKVKHWYVSDSTELKPFIEKGWRILKSDEIEQEKVEIKNKEMFRSDLKKVNVLEKQRK